MISKLNQVAQILRRKRFMQLDKGSAEMILESLDHIGEAKQILRCIDQFPVVGNTLRYFGTKVKTIRGGFPPTVGDFIAWGAIMS